MATLDVVTLVGKIVDRVIPDPVAAAEAKLKVAQLAQNGELEALHADVQLAQGQIDTNKIEAASASTFKSGWRPYIGWVCGAGCSWNWVLLPVANFTMKAIGHPVDMAPADLSEMLPLLMGLLGLGTLRTYERVKGKA
jgi:hypothetical protein